MKKQSLASALLEYIDNMGRDCTLSELYMSVIDIQPELAKVYASLHSLASSGKCDRGSRKQTWTSKGKGRSAGVPIKPSISNVVKKTKVVDDQFGKLIDGLKEMFGRNVKRDDKLKAIVIEEGTGPYKKLSEYVSWASNLLGQPVNAWFSYRVGEGEGILHIGLVHKPNHQRIEADQTSSTITLNGELIPLKNQV